MVYKGLLCKSVQGLSLFLMTSVIEEKNTLFSRFIRSSDEHCSVPQIFNFRLSKCLFA
jgi:hypothetical protein